MARKSSRQTRDLSVVDRCEEMFETALHEIKFDRPLAPLLLWLLGGEPRPSCEEAARIVGVSRTTLHRMCKATFGVSYTSLATAISLEHAGDLVLSRRFTCKAIAEKVGGFGSAEAFCRAFKRRFAVAPTRFTRPPGARPFLSRLKELEEALEGLEGLEGLE